MSSGLIEIRPNESIARRTLKKTALITLHSGSRLRGLFRPNHPRFPASAVRWLEEYLRPDMHCFEWGSGGSSVWLARRTASLVSVEHDRAWYELLLTRTRRSNLANLTLIFAPPDPSTGETSPDYYNCITEYPDARFDFIVIDGRRRLQCAQNSVSKVKPGGVVLYDDVHRDPGVNEIFGSWVTLCFESRVSRAVACIRP